MDSHQRRRSLSSSSSSDDAHRHRREEKKHKAEWGYVGTGHSAAAAGTPVGVPSTHLSNDRRDLLTRTQPTARQRSTMSGPGFPDASSPPPYHYGAPSYAGGSQGFVDMPNASSSPHFAPPPGPPPFPQSPSEGPAFPAPRGEPGFPSPHSPDFPSAHGDAGFLPPAATSGVVGAPDFPSPPTEFPSSPTSRGIGEITHDRGFHIPGFPSHHQSPQGTSPPPPTAPQAHGGLPPPSGFRVPLDTNAAFPSYQAGQPIGYDADGCSPIFIGSALLEKSVHPCKIVPSLTPACRVPYAGTEYEHHGRYDLLPFDPTTMEWVYTSQGRIPAGRRPVEGGYEDYGGKLYHALALFSGVQVPGKTGEHLGGCNIAFGGGEHVVQDYQLLCWK